MDIYNFHLREDEEKKFDYLKENLVNFISNYYRFS